MAEQRAKCVEQQRKLGFGERWLEQIPEILDGVDLENEKAVLLHTEVMSVHLLRQDGKLSGLFDFEPAMRGSTSSSRRASS
ncbi:phosphotransferase [Lentzea aerocolonigenes]|uniref:phosphotransferase n=1 Tax=Lentzea aerocolonigenes TaxID=68170 RepID=UPI0006980B86|nr:phosphotransferase [Lentzea aerocolonigenes]